MTDTLLCYRCGHSLEALSLPLSRHDQCPACSNYLHVCRMCVHYDTAAPGQCLEDDAEDVTEKERPNFCDWFVPATGGFDTSRRRQEDAARAELDALFGDGDAATDSADDALSEAEKLFK